MYTEIYFEDSDAEIIEYFEEREKAMSGEEYSIHVLTKWFSEPVPIHANDESGDLVWSVLLTDTQYIDRKDNQAKLDKSFKKLDKKFKKLKVNELDPDEPLHVFGPMGRTHHAPEEREEEDE